MKDVYGLNLQIKNNLDAIADNARKLKGLEVMQWAFTVGTFAIYFSFTTVIFGGVSVWGLQEYLFKNSTNTIALVWVVVVIFVVPLALSLGKHYNYQSISDSFINRNRASLIIHSMIGLALISGVYYEAISSSANLQAKAFNAVDYKGNLANILNSGNSVTADSGLSADIANAQMKLAQCEERLKQGKEKHCEGSKAKLTALKEQSDATLKASADASANAVTAKGDVLKNAVDEQSLPAAKWFAQTFSMSNDGGTMMIVIIAALFFELIHLTTVFSEIRALIRKQELKTNGEHMQNAYFNATGKVYNPDDFKDERVIDLSKDELAPTNPAPTFQDDGYEIRTKGQPYKDNKTGFGFVPQTAARFKWQDSEIELPAKPERTFGFIPSRSGDSLAAENRRKYPQEIVMPMTDRPTPHDYGAVPRKEHKHPSPHAGTVPTTPTGTAPARPLEQTVYTALEQPTAGTGTAGDDDAGTPADRAAFEAHNHLYPQWRAEVQRGEMAATARACRDFVAKHTGVDALSMRQAKYIWNEWGKRAVGENVLSLNPEYSPGNRKLKYLKAA